MGGRVMARRKRTPLTVPPDPVILRMGQAARCWRETQTLDGTEGARFLRALGWSGPWPSCLRFNWRLVHPQDPGAVPRPAIVARAVKLADGPGPGTPTGVFRLFLAPGGAGVAALPLPCVGLGVLAGAVVRLSTPTRARLVLVPSLLGAIERAIGEAALGEHGASVWAVPVGLDQMADPVGFDHVERATV